MFQISARLRVCYCIVNLDSHRGHRFTGSLSLQTLHSTSLVGLHDDSAVSTPMTAPNQMPRSARQRVVKGKADGTWRPRPWRPRLRHRLRELRQVELHAERRVQLCILWRASQREEAGGGAAIEEGAWRARPRRIRLRSRLRAHLRILVRARQEEASGAAVAARQGRRLGPRRAVDGARRVGVGGVGGSGGCDTREGGFA